MKQCNNCKSTNVVNGYCMNCNSRVWPFTRKQVIATVIVVFLFLCVASGIQNDWFI